MPPPAPTSPLLKKMFPGLKIHRSFCYRIWIRNGSKVYSQTLVYVYRGSVSAEGSGHRGDESVSSWD